MLKPKPELSKLQMQFSGIRLFKTPRKNQVRADIKQIDDTLSNTEATSKNQATPEFKLKRFNELIPKQLENQILTPLRHVAAGPVSGANIINKKVLQKSVSVPTLGNARSLSFGMLPAIPEVNRSMNSIRQYQSESKYRRDLLTFASYNAAGLLNNKSLPQLESPERQAKRALIEAK